MKVRIVAIIGKNGTEKSIFDCGRAPVMATLVKVDTEGTGLPPQGNLCISGPDIDTVCYGVSSFTMSPW